MIDRFIYRLCDILDRYTDWINKIFESKPRKKRKKMNNDTYEEFVKEFPEVDEKHYIIIRGEADKFNKLGITVQEYYRELLKQKNENIR